jgi:cyclopropane fatty-acyl-phospholipid synthase-like methyltransferase
MLQLSATETLIPASPALVQLYTNGYNEELFPNKIVKLIRDCTKHCEESSLAEYDEHNNLLHYHQ